MKIYKEIVNGASNKLSRPTTEKKNLIKDQDEKKEIIRRLRIQNKKLQEQLASLRKRIKQGNAEKAKIVDTMDQTKKRNDLLAEALGSCSNCWGEDPHCPVCSGNGISGWHKINKRLFNVYVLPALEKLYSLSRKIR